jgi:hypothetical protein
MNTLLIINGGMGKAILFTAVAKAFKAQHPDSKLIVVTAWPDVFYNNPNVDRVYAANEAAYLYEDYIEKGYRAVLEDPYNTWDWVKPEADKHLAQIWSEMLGVEYGGEQPELYFTHSEKVRYKNNIKIDKPILVYQGLGGAKQDPNEYGWWRDIPNEWGSQILAQYSDHFRVQVGLPGTTQIENVDQLVTGMGTRDFLALCYFADFAIGGDSVLQHVRGCGNKPSLFYVKSDNIIKKLGWKNSIFKLPKEEKQIKAGKFAFRDRTDITGIAWEDPFMNPYEIWD